MYARGNILSSFDTRFRKWDIWYQYIKLAYAMYGREIHQHNTMNVWRGTWFAPNSLYFHGVPSIFLFVFNQFGQLVIV